jgi:hypothetical protein
MSRERVLRWSGLAAIASGALLLILALALLTARAGAAVPDPAVTALRLGANSLAVLALVGIYVALSPWAGRLGQAGIVLAVAGLLLLLTGLVPIAGSSLLLAGLLLCALACTRAGLGTGPGLWLWLAGAGLAFAMALAGMPVLAALGLMVSGCGRIWLGSSARRERPALARTPGLETAASPG